MADENEGAQNVPGTSDNAQGGDNAGDTSQNVSGAAEGAQEGDDSTTNDTVTRSEFDQLKKRMQAADKRASDALAELDQRKRADQDELTNAKQDLEKAQKRIAELEKQIDKTALENAFLTDNGHEWVDSSDALRLLDMDGVEVKEGTVTGLKPAIEKLAKAKPHLLKPETGSGKGSSSEASGSAGNGRRKGQTGERTVDYTNRFPALRKR